MDPDAILANIASNVAFILAHQHSVISNEIDPAVVLDVAEIGCELAESVKALDEWIRKGGFLPGAWTTATKNVQ